jgi:hypothetical protein
MPLHGHLRRQVSPSRPQRRSAWPPTATESPRNGPTTPVWAGRSHPPRNQRSASHTKLRQRSAPPPRHRPTADAAITRARPTRRAATSTGPRTRSATGCVRHPPPLPRSPRLPSSATGGRNAGGAQRFRAPRPGSSPTPDGDLASSASRGSYANLSAPKLHRVSWIDRPPPKPSQQEIRRRARATRGADAQLREAGDKV